MLFDKVVSIKRLKENATDSDKEAYEAIAGLKNVKINIQPASPEYTAIADGVFGKTYRAYLTQSGILDGDELTVSGTNEVYKVRGVEDWNFPPLPHFELTLFEAE